MRKISFSLPWRRKKSQRVVINDYLWSEVEESPTKVVMTDLVYLNPKTRQLISFSGFGREKVEIIFPSVEDLKKELAEMYYFTYRKNEKYGNA
jgi:hypothetical protein